MWPLFACDSTSAVQLSHTSAKMAPRYSQKRFSIWRPSAVLNLRNFDFLSNIHPRNGNSHPYTKFDRNRIIRGWDREIILFSKWRLFVILNLRKLSIWSRDLYPHGIFHLHSKFRINRPIWRRHTAKNDFQYGVRPPSWICKIADVLKYPVFHVSALWLEIAYFGLIFDVFSEK